MTKVRVHVGPSASVDPINVTPVRLTPSPVGMRREVLVLRNAQGELRAYRNECKHLPILLDAGSRNFLSKDGEYIFCATHGARYERDDGLCVFGPCRGASLDPVAMEIEDGELYVIDDGR